MSDFTAEDFLRRYLKTAEEKNLRPEQESEVLYHIIDEIFEHKTFDSDSNTEEGKKNE